MALNRIGPRIGVVLSSDGASGAYAHTGFLLALKRLGVPVHALAGSSAGAVVGGIAASGTDLHAWSEALAQVEHRHFWRPDAWPMLLWRLTVHQGRGYTGLSGTGTAMEFCRQQLTAQTFETCRYPFHALAVSLGRGRKVMIFDGELAPRMVTSTAIPILYRPVEIDGEWCCGGALVGLAPMDTICCKHGLDALLIHHVAPRQTDIEPVLHGRWAILVILDRLLLRHRPWYLSEELLTIHRCPCGCGAAVVVIKPQLPELPWPMRMCAGPQYARRDFPVALAPSVTAHSLCLRIRCGTPRTPCGRAWRSPAPDAARPQWLNGAMGWLLRPPAPRLPRTTRHQQLRAFRGSQLWYGD